jgi:hypothetical protein
MAGFVRPLEEDRGDFQQLRSLGGRVFPGCIDFAPWFVRKDQLWTSGLDSNVPVAQQSEAQTFYPEGSYEFIGLSHPNSPASGALSSAQ